jgi:hypothetical protein
LETKFLIYYQFQRVEENQMMEKEEMKARRKSRRGEKRGEEKEKCCPMHRAAKSHFRALCVSDMMSIARKLISS